MNRGEKGNTGICSYTFGGNSGWARVAYLDMTNSSYQCPGGMKEITLSGREYVDEALMPSIVACLPSSQPIGNSTQYSQVCGRITGY